MAKPTFVPDAFGNPVQIGDKIVFVTSKGRMALVGKVTDLNGKPRIITQQLTSYDTFRRYYNHPSRVALHSHLEPFLNICIIAGFGEDALYERALWLAGIKSFYHEYTFQKEMEERFGDVSQ